MDVFLAYGGGSSVFDNDDDNDNDDDDDNDNTTRMPWCLGR